MSKPVDGVLCLHGFTNVPREVSFLAKSLHRRGFTVETPTLPGHATTPEELNRTTRSEWKSAVARELRDLLTRCDRVAVVGQSMGGLLALDAAADGPEVAAVVALATPLWLERATELAISGLARLPRSLILRIPHLKKSRGSDVRDHEVRAENLAYPVLPIAGVIELSALMADVASRLDQVAAPILVIHGRQDHTAPVACADAIVHGVASTVRSLSILPRSYHLISCDVERELVAQRVGTFLDRAMDR